MSDMTVGCIRTTVNHHQSSGVYEVLFEKTKKELDEVYEELSGKIIEFDELFDEAEKIRAERDHYKTSIETLNKSINDWNTSMVKEPADDFVTAIASFIEAKLNKE